MAETVETVPADQLLINYRYYPEYYGRLNTQYSHRQDALIPAQSWEAFRRRHPSAYVRARAGEQYRWPARCTRMAVVVRPFAIQEGVPK